MRIILNSTPIIALSYVNKYEILRYLFNEIFIPETVYNELTHHKNKPGSQETKNADWLKVLKFSKELLIPPYLLG